MTLLRSAADLTRYVCSLMPGSTDRLIRDLKRAAHTDLTQTAAADCARDGRSSPDPSPRKEDESVKTLTPDEREDFFLGMNEADLVAFVTHVKNHFEVIFDDAVAEVERLRAEDDQAMTATKPAFEES